MMYLLIFVAAFAILFVLMSLSRLIAFYIDSKRSKKDDNFTSGQNPEDKIIEITDYEIETQDDGDSRKGE